MYLTKTDYLEYLQCPKNLWLKKRSPDLYIEEPTSDFDLKNFREGQEVENLARKLYSNGIMLKGTLERIAEETNKLVQSRKSPLFQATFITKRHLLAKIDVLAYNDDLESWDIFEVKSTSSVKKDRDHNHIKDVAFQKLVLEECGLKVGKTNIIHLNKEYKRKGELDINKLFHFSDITDEVNNSYDSTGMEVKQAIDLLNKDSIDLSSCSCLYLTRTNHCSSFSVLNPDVPDYSVHDISRIRTEKIKELIESDILCIKDIPEDYSLTENQRRQVRIEKLQAPIIESREIKRIIKGIEYPLYFLDYETYNPAIPILDGFSPNQHIPFQVSIHKIDSDSKLEHYEFLADHIEDCVLDLISCLKKIISSQGTIISWYAPFENTRNNEMSEIYPEHADFLINLNKRTFDLEKVFKKHYLHPNFQGRSSIKKVLPVLIPDFSYENLDMSLTQKLHHEN